MTAGFKGVTNIAHPLQPQQKVDAILNDLDRLLQQQEREFHHLARDMEADDDRIMINDCVLRDLEKEVIMVELLHNESIKDVEVARQRLQGIKEQLHPMESYLDQDDYARSIDPLKNQNNKMLATWTDEKRKEMYNLASNVGTQLRGIHDKIGYVVDQINMRNQGLHSGDHNDPIEAITRTLNMQLTSLKWAEQKSAAIESHVRGLQQKRLMLVQAQQRA